MRSNNTANLPDPFATALGSDTDSKSLGYFRPVRFADESQSSFFV